MLLLLADACFPTGGDVKSYRPFLISTHHKSIIHFQFHSLAPGVCDLALLAELYHSFMLYKFEIR